MQLQRTAVLSASRLLRQAAAKGQFGFHPFLPKPMAGLGNIAAPQRIVCRARERFLHLHSLRGQKAGLSALCEFRQPAANGSVSPPSRPPLPDSRVEAAGLLGILCTARLPSAAIKKDP